jgi:formamidopyrimidine-DNA glycosylase
MPELPEVETTRRGLEPWVVSKTISRLEVRDGRLRWPVARGLAERLAGQHVTSLERRGKYLLINIQDGALIVHLGMSGSLRFLPQDEALTRHDHVDIEFADGGRLRFNDPRRFGSLHFSRHPLQHPLLRDIGPEPLSAAFTVDYLHSVCRGRRVAIKQLVMNGRVVAGVGNIYANEALFRAAIHPFRAAGRVGHARVERLIHAIQSVLGEAIEQGGTTLRDFIGGDGRPGYFKQSLFVYDRAGEPCKRCGKPIRQRTQAQRATYYCVKCQR